jgi:hypothetical protein
MMTTTSGARAPVHERFDGVLQERTLLVGHDTFLSDVARYRKT